MAPREPAASPDGLRAAGSCGKARSAEESEALDCRFAGSADNSIVVLAWTPAAVATVCALPASVCAGAAAAVVVALCVLGGERCTPEALPGDVAWPHYKRTNVHTAKINMLLGISLGAWLELLSQRWRQIDWHVYGVRLFVLTLMAAVNSLLELLDVLLYGRCVERVELDERPVFVLGHPRTGTTHLHNLLALDHEQFIYPNTFDCGFVHGIFVLDKIKSLFAGFIDKTRPMDSMPLDFTTPQEDELSLVHLSGGKSPYMPMPFMTNEPEFRKYFSFEEAAPEERDQWVAALRHFMRRVQASNEVLRGKRGRRMVLKSPCHVSRAKLLHQLFPKAQFVYIHRDPYVVWRSAVNMARTTYPFFYLAQPSDAMINNFILSQYDILFQGYQEAKRCIPASQFAEVSFRELTFDTVPTMRRLYEHFGWDGWQRFQGELEAYLGTLATYRKNKFDPLDESIRAYLYERWKPSFQALGYPEEQREESPACA